ncbi:alpha/beta fold hydrolase [Paenibacillus woosongensis]|uniref:Alpha/beta fold hydrolase n=1 Tax=Paenibacillus woosongensis TaxID=307580 RepID=A0A7X2Z566_9BACL|nr:alpha/beta hydrolase [Paenibacillus woosongensis]MUG47014.1 alpha/beta fold hydrolase [Paenibacillus woosongensis]
MADQHHLELSDARLFYRTNGSGQPLIFIHGNFNDHHIWEEQADFFGRYAQDVQVIRYDLRGYGGSSTPASSFSHVHDLKCLIEHLHLNAAVLIGSSMGGGIALDFALAYPEYVRALVLAAPSVTNQRYPWKMLWKGISNFYQLRFRGSQSAIEAFIQDDYWSYFFPSPHRRAAREKVLRNVRNPDNFCRFPPRLALPPRISSMQRLNEIQVPTLIVAADGDHPFNLKTAGDLSKLIPQASGAMFHDCGHLPFIEQPDKFNQTLLAFIQPMLSGKRQKSLQSR